MPMVSLEVHRRIAAPPHEVFAFVATDHFENHPKWDPAVIEIRADSSDAMHPGMTARVLRQDRGERVEGTLTVTRYEPDSVFAATVEFGAFTLHQHVTCIPAAGGTELHLRIDSEAKGLLNLMLPLMKPRFRKTMESSVDTIKRLVEQGWSASPPTDLVVVVGVMDTSWHQSPAFFANDYDTVRQLYGPEAVVEVPDAGELKGGDEIVEYMRGLIDAFPDARFQSAHAFESGSTAVDEGRFVGTHTGVLRMPDGDEVPATGRRVSLRSCDVATVENGRITSHRFYFDQLDLMTQLGLVSQQ
jgi:predicted ester cyclase